ncbi:MAG: TIGR03086 family metal-binding protein [Actinobacteria bacterium]|nr:TIGR03086 family metal-binding protein [Actinomycetota bacterium]
MSETKERYERVAKGFDDRLARVGANQWSLRTPCEEWDVRALVSHVIATHWRVVAAVTGQDPPKLDAEEDLIAQWAAATDAVVASLDDPERSQKVVSGMFGTQPFESLVSRLLCADTLFHTWDLARATGQDETLDPDAVAKAMEFLEPLDDAIRKPGGFSEKIDAPSGADAQTRLLNFGGRATT